MRYPSNGAQRLLKVDLLRGLFLVVIIVDHLQRFPGLYDLFTGRGWLWASAAEGFFFLSGMMVGVVYGRRLLKKGFEVVLVKLWRRAGLLYLLSVGLTLLFTLLSVILGHSPLLKPGVAQGLNWVSIVQEAITFKYVYGWADFLQYYAVFMAVSPLAIWLLRRRWWPAVVGLSLLAWSLNHRDMYLSWQILFFSGAIYGFYMQPIEQFVRQLPRLWRRVLVGSWLSAAGVTYVLSYIFVHGKPFLEHRPVLDSSLPVNSTTLNSIDTVIGPHFDKVVLPDARLAVFWLWFFALYYLVGRYQQQINHYAGWLLVTLGRNSLYAYITHSVVLFLLPLLVPGGSHLLVNFAVNTAAIVMVWAVVRHRRRLAATMRGLVQPLQGAV
jgi:hypothetical protein